MNEPSRPGAVPGGRRAAVDDVDRRILRVLQQDARTSVADLARRVNVSRANAYARLERLTAGGVIAGYEVRVEPRAVGLDVAALIFLNADQSKWRQLWAKLQTIPEVQFMGLATGDFDVVVLVRTATPEDLRDVVLERLHSLPEVRSTRTMLLLQDLDRPPAIPDRPPVRRP
ncbi:MAG TPA: Lrp/AsnC family transcriptional regulator [Acidimicrobiia bacterium]|nr:Lrp/AsnC family transcriptional regulator [Acidimicrobiia bacterium]